MQHDAASTTISIVIAPMGRKGNVRNLDLKSTCTVRDLRIAAEKATGVPSAQQKLIFRGKLLKNGKTLDQYNLKNGSRISMVVLAQKKEKERGATDAIGIEEVAKSLENSATASDSVVLARKAMKKIDSAMEAFSLTGTSKEDAAILAADIARMSELLRIVSEKLASWTPPGQTAKAPSALGRTKVGSKEDNDINDALASVAVDMEEEAAKVAQQKVKKSQERASARRMKVKRSRRVVSGSSAQKQTKRTPFSTNDLRPRHPAFAFVEESKRGDFVAGLRSDAVELRKSVTSKMRQSSLSDTYRRFSGIASQ